MPVPPHPNQVLSSSYSYGSDIAPNAFFLATISFSLLCCLGISLKTQRCLPFSAVLCTTCILEIVSYAQRLQSWGMTSYIVDVVLSTIAPVFLTTGIHICAAKIISILGPEHAILKPNRHLRIFIWTDIFAGTLQATGLGLIFANAEASRGSPKGIQLSGLAPTGQFIVYAGLLLQATSLLVGLCLLAMTYTRAGKASRQYGYTTFHKDAGYVPLSSRFKTFLVVLPLAAICVLVRTAYRAAGFFDGLDGAIASNEMVYLGAEGVMLTEAMASLAFFHPALWLDDGKDAELKDKDLQRRKSRDVEENLDEVSELILKTNLIAPSDASSSDGGSRRGSDAVSRHSEDITAAEARLVREEEDDHLEVVSIELPTRNPSRRVPGERDDNMEEVSLYSQVDEEEDRLEVVSIELPTRNPSKRVAGEEDSPYAQSVYSQ